MSIIIQNISSEFTPVGINTYQVRINNKVICEFEHDRTPNGLVKCLRDAADAVQAEQDHYIIEMLRELQ